MPTIQISVDVKGGDLKKQIVEVGEHSRTRVINASHDALRRASSEIIDQGRADIAGAGRFGSRWTEGLQSALDLGTERSLVTIFHLIPYWRIFEFGGTVKGKPLLWIPLSFSDAVGIKARDYGPLFRVDRKIGAPLLFSITDKEPKYSGHESVFIPKKFHILSIARDVAGRLADFYREALNG